MSKQSLKNRLLTYLQKHYPEKIAKGDLDRMVMANTKFIPENCGRRLRELQNEGLLEVSYGNKNHAFYQASKPKETVKYINTDNKEIIINRW